MTTFTGFSGFTRPEIGLLADGTQNLGEIFSSDRNNALSNILLREENLSYIYGLSNLVDREDLRMASGLTSQLLPSLHILDRVFNKEIKTLLEDSQTFATPTLPLGSDPTSPTLSGALIKTKNIIIYNGAIQCEGAEYKTNVLKENLFESPDRRLVQVSISRTSLFNSEKWSDGTPNEGNFKNAYYSGSIRVRRRSHVSRIEIPEYFYLPKTTGGGIVENPSHTILLNIDSGNTGTNVPLKLLATKNSPLKIPCRLANGKIKFSFEDSISPYFYGFQIQPADSKGEESANLPFLPLDPKVQTSGSLVYEIDVDVTSTGYQNAYDLYLYLYLNPEKVTGLEFSGIDIKDFNDLKDIGLIGFNKLKTLRLDGTSIKILPIWLKTLGNTLETLDIEKDKDTYRLGPLTWFDYRDLTADPTIAGNNIPLYTGISYLTIPVKGPILNEENNGWSNQKFEKYVLNNTRVIGTDYRVFTNLKSLLLGDKFLGKNVRLDDVFPNLQRLSWNGKFSTPGMVGEDRRLFGTPPKINNHGGIIFSYDISRTGAEGTIVDIGTSTNINNLGHISKYKIESFNLSGSAGGGGFTHQITGTISPVGQDWQTWWNTTKVINLLHCKTKTNLQTSSPWKELEDFNCAGGGGVTFAANSPPLNTPKLKALFIALSESTGPFPSLGDIGNTSELKTIIADQVNGMAPIEEIPINSGGLSYLYILPQTFAPNRTSGVHKLETFSWNSSTISGRFRIKDFRYVYKLNSFNVNSSPNITGKFFKFPTDQLPATQQKFISINISNCSFYDLTNLSISPADIYFSRDIVSILAVSQNISGGGVKLPEFSGVNNSKIITLRFNNSLPTRYPDNWLDASKRGAVILPTDSSTSVSNLSINRSIYAPSELSTNSWSIEDNIYTLFGATGEDYSSRVLVNDSISETDGGVEVARVLSVNGNTIVIDRDITTNPLPSSLFFRRNTTDISEWFSTGFTNLQEFGFTNCRLSGNINFTGATLSKLVDGSFIALNLSDNAISGYVPGSLARIFSGLNRKITIDLSRNILSRNVIRSLLSDVITLDNLKKFTNCQIQLYQCKLDINNYYTTYSQSDIFTNTIEDAPDLAISLFRNETVKVYQIINNPDGTMTKVWDGISSKVIRVPGAFVPSLNGYYKQRINKRKRIVEDPLGTQFKTLSGIKVNFDFIYKSPSIVPYTVEVIHPSSGETTRATSLEELGYTVDDLVTPL